MNPCTLEKTCWVSGEEKQGKQASRLGESMQDLTMGVSTLMGTSQLCK